METLRYHPHEAKRHTASIKETVQRACESVFTEPGIIFRVTDGPWYRRGPSERVTVTVVQNKGCCQRRPICTVDIDRPKNDAGLHEYLKATATLMDVTQHAGATRLLGHLRRQCPFLPAFDVTMTYDLPPLPDA
jgi:hypothetical protein